MEEFMKVIIFRIRNMVLGFINGQMEGYMRVLGPKVNNMGKVIIHNKTEK